MQSLTSDPYGRNGLLQAAILACMALISSLCWGASSSDFSDPYSGSYRVSADHYIGINRFIMDNGEDTLLIADYSSSIVRRLFPVSSTEFVMGEGFNSASPVELNVRFVNDKEGVPTGISMRRADGTKQFAQRVPLNREEVSFQGADAKLVGTLFMPSAKGPHPAIILLHGSGPLTRYSFGPYPHFFTSLGYAVLIYDKRGSGASTGTRTDASTGAAMTPTFYPDELARDALAAFRLLQQRPGIDSRRIGFWGSSEGGMLATQVAARSKDVAFAINSSGFMGPLWETFRYQPASVLRASGASEATIERQSALVNLWLEVARTGKGWEQFQERRREAVQADGFWFFQSRGDPTSVEQLRWDWDHVLSFDSLPALQSVEGPILAVFGGLDVLTEATKAKENMERVLTLAGHKEFTIKIFPKGSHSLMEMPSKNYMAPGVFETLRTWLPRPDLRHSALGSGVRVLSSPSAAQLGTSFCQTRCRSHPRSSPPRDPACGDL